MNNYSVLVLKLCTVDNILTPFTRIKLNLLSLYFKSYVLLTTFQNLLQKSFLFQFRYEVCLKTLHDIPNYVEKRTIRQDYIEKNFN